MITARILRSESMNICVYGASSKTIDKSYVKAGEHLGRIMVERGHKLVFGG